METELTIHDDEDEEDDVVTELDVVHALDELELVATDALLTEAMEEELVELELNSC